MKRLETMILTATYLLLAGTVWIVVAGAMGCDKDYPRSDKCGVVLYGPEEAWEYMPCDILQGWTVRFDSHWKLPRGRSSAHRDERKIYVAAGKDWRMALLHEVEHARLWSEGYHGSLHHSIMYGRGTCYGKCGVVENLNP